MEKGIEALIIESKQGVHDLYMIHLNDCLQALMAAADDHVLYDDDRRMMKAKADLIRDIQHGLLSKYKSHIEEVKHRYKNNCKCSDISTDYFQNLKGWTPSA